MNMFAEECEKLEPEVQGLCPEGFLDECNTHCYKMSLPTSDAATWPVTKKSWDAAKQECQKYNSSLLSIRTEKDQRCIEKYLERAASPVWLGLYEEVNPITNAPTWTWMDDSIEYGEGSYKNWNTGDLLIH